MIHIINKNQLNILYIKNFEKIKIHIANKIASWLNKNNTFITNNKNLAIRQNSKIVKNIVKKQHI